MSRLIRILPISIAATLAALAAAATPSPGAPAVGREEPAGPPVALRAERVFDRGWLERLGVPRPSRLAFDGEGNLYVLDAVSRRVVKLDPRGTALFDLGGYGDDAASFSLPADLAVDRRESLLVLDRGRGAVIAFDRSGRFLGARSFAPDLAAEASTPAARLLLDPLGGLWLLAVRERDLVPLDERLERARRSRFLAPEESVGTVASAAFLPGGGAWLYDARSLSLRRFGASGRLLRAVPLADSSGIAGSGGMASDRDGYLYAADLSGQRLLVYDRDGTLRLTRALGGASSRWRPAAIAVASDRVAIADPERGEVQILAIERERAP